MINYIEIVYGFKYGRIKHIYKCYYAKKLF